MVIGEGIKLGRVPIPALVRVPFLPPTPDPFPPMLVNFLFTCIVTQNLSEFIVGPSNPCLCFGTQFVIGLDAFN